MGWTGTHKPKHESMRDFFAREFRPYEVVEFSLRGWTEAYAVLRHPETGEVYGMAIMLHHTRDYFNITYKDMDEGMGPVISNMPVKFLDRLDRERPLNDENDPRGRAREWRARCRKNAEERKGPKVKPGDTLVWKDDEAPRFGAYGKVTSGTVVRKTRGGSVVIRLAGNMLGKVSGACANTATVTPA